MALIGAAVALAGCIGIDDLDPLSAEPIEDEPPLPEDGSHVVVAVIDTGTNPYHEEFHDPDRWTDPSTPTSEAPSPSTPALDKLHEPLQDVTLSLENDDWETAVEDDWETLTRLEEETLYTFPGTKILGAISFMEPPDDWPLILDRPGEYTHGTMTSSRAVADTISIGGDDPGIWLVMVQGFTTDAVEWTAQQDWIDIVSISAGLSPYTTFPAAPNAMDQGAIDAYQDLASQKPFFASSGNGIANAGAAGYPVWLRGSSGAPDAISVGATDNDHLTQWHNQDPYIAADGCSNPAVQPDSTTEIDNTGGGTSSATPYSAGGGAAMLLEARRLLDDNHVGPRTDANLTPPDGAWDSQNPTDATVILAHGDAPTDEGPLADGTFTLREFKDVLYHTALPTPTETPSDGDRCVNSALPPDAVPQDQRFPFLGYGEINQPSIQHALEVLRGDQPLPDRPTADWHYERAHSHKATLVDQDPTLPSPSVGLPQR